MDISTKTPPQPSSFIASPTWTGSKPGYYFGTGQQGTGYYLDKYQQKGGDMVVEGQDSKQQPKKRGVQFAEEKNEMKLLLREAEQRASDTYVVDLTPKGIQSASNALSKIFKKNSMARVKYADQPEQYMESEIQLYDQLSALQAIGADSKLYRHVVETSDLVPVLVQLLGHENTDVSACVVALFYQLIDPTLIDDDPDCIPIMGRLASTVVQQAWETMVSNLYQFQDNNNNNNNNKDDGTSSNGNTADDDTQDPNLKCIDNTLSLMENLLEVDALMAPYGGGILSSSDDQNHHQQQQQSDDDVVVPSVAAYMVRESSIVAWLFHQLESSGSASSASAANQQQDDPIAASKEEEFKGRCMEMIAFLSQNSDIYDSLPDWNALPRVKNSDGSSSSSKPPAAKKQKGSSVIEGIDILLQSIGRYRKRQPSNSQQIEFLENACITLSSCITFSDINMKHFVDLEGVPLVMFCEKNNVHSGCSTLRLLDFSSEGAGQKKAAEEVVTCGLLKYLFPLFLGARIPKPASPLKSVKAKRVWLNDVKTRTIRALYGLSLHLDKNSPEDGQARFIAKFVEDNQKNCDRLVELLLEYDGKARKAEYKFFRSDIDETIGADEDQLALAAFDAKLKNGGDMCHRLAAIAAYVCARSKRCHERVISQLKLQQAGVSLIKESLKEFSSSLRPGKQQEHIDSIIEQI